MKTLSVDYGPTLRWYEGVAKSYNSFRPSPPPQLAKFVLDSLRRDRVELVVDLGSGTGLSTRYWSGFSVRVVGVEPSVQMYNEAKSSGGALNVSYLNAFAHDTGIASQSADLVTCFQSFHWMEPTATLTEIRRILKPGGILAIADYDWPPWTSSWEMDRKWSRSIALAREKERDMGLSSNLKQWDKKGHLSSIKASGHFQQFREIMIHHSESCDANQFVGLLRTQGGISAALNAGISESELELDLAAQSAGRVLGSEAIWHWSTLVRLAAI